MSDHNKGMFESTELLNDYTDANALRAEVAAAAALVSENNAAASEVATAADLVATNQDTLDTAADLVQTNLDTIATAADRVQTGLDAAATAADVVLTNADVVLTNADVVTVAGIYDDFDDRYLGPKASPPTLDNDGGALVVGALYFNTSTDYMYVRNSSNAWQVIEAGAGAGDMVAATYDPTTVAGDAFAMDNMVEGATTKIMTNTERTKLSGIETGATADQTGAEIKVAYEAEVNTNAYTDAEKTKLAGVATGADVTSANETSHADVLVDLDIGVTVQGYDANLPTWPATVNATEVGYLDGLGGNIQTLLNNKVTKQTLADNAVVRANGTAGDVQNSGVTIDDSDNVSGAGTPIVNKIAAYGFASGDEGKTFTMTGTFDFTIPAQTSVNFAIGTTFNVVNIGTGTVGVGITTDNLNGATTTIDLSAQWSGATIIKTAANTWVIMGDTA